MFSLAFLNGVMWKKWLLISGFCIALLGFVVYAHGRAAGIHTISNEAVYISGEACVINTPLEKSLETIQKEFDQCLRFHKQYRDAKGPQ